MNQQNQRAARDAKELAYLYDLYVVPGWREIFDELVDAEVKLPAEGKFLEVGCGTGSYAIDLAAKLGPKAEIVAVDESGERLALAQGKAEVKKITNVTFDLRPLDQLGFGDREFDFVVADASLLPSADLPAYLEELYGELTRVAKPGATVVLKLATRGSFDEFYSIYWEALHNLGLEEYTPQLEDLINERPTVEQSERVAREAGLKHLRSVTRKQRFDYPDAAAFLDAPLIETSFLGHWLSMLADEQEVGEVRDELAGLIDRERGDLDFDVSIKATLIIGQK